ncbi:hypothetical protein ACFLXA_05560 [Chloroflexota bacterium]
MKKRLAIAVVLALVMLVTLATPVLAGKQGKLTVHYYGAPMYEVKGSCSLRATHNNELKITVSLSGVKPGTYYIKWASVGTENPSGASIDNATDPVSFTVGANYRGRFRGIVVNPHGAYQFSDWPGKWGFRVSIYDNAGFTGSQIYESKDGEYMYVTFK